MFNVLRDQIDPTIASISTIMIVVTSIMMVLAQVFGRSKADK
jgi:putative spermidine/putrescine transport system permease protein